jgi:probable DNA metabolism protein
MQSLHVHDFDDWRTQARALLQAGVPPTAVRFAGAGDARQASLFDDEASVARKPNVVQRVPPKFLELARKVACHRDVGRFDLLYRALWRLTHGEPHLLEIATDDDVYPLTAMEKAVRRAAHKTKAFVRFRKVDAAANLAVEEAVAVGEQYVAWHRPEHRVLPLVAPFFSRRFPAMRWTILTPDESVSWDLSRLTFGPGVPESEAPDGDGLEDLWRAYYGATFNPARIKLKTMKREMPVRHWRTLPETSIVDDLLADAPRRVAEMIAHAASGPRSAADFLPPERDLAALAAAARACQGCELHTRATQTVFGAGSPTARLMLVGEQPGDEEDRAGTPFIGPAGHELDEALRRAGIGRDDIYVTNAVKHFHWEPQGKRRLHKKPPARAVAACRPWLDAELAAIRPRVLVCLGATAAQAVLGRDARMQRPRGEFFASPAAERTLITWHPAAILRAPTAADQQRRREDFAEHLRAAMEQSFSLGEKVADRPDEGQCST